MNLWLFFLILTGSAFFWKFDELKKDKSALLSGLILVFIDILFQTSGFYLGLWDSHNVIFGRIGRAPISVLMMAFMGGSLFTYFYPERPYYTKQASWLLSASFLGAFMERILISHGYLSYLNWNSVLAFLSYAFWLYILRNAYEDIKRVIFKKRLE